MEMACTLQETYNIWSWLLPLISGSIGALIGTYGGAYFLHGKQEQKVKNIRAMAVKALDILKTYKTYADAINEFNTKLNVSEKRAVTVALHKLGVPFETPTKDALDIKNIRQTREELLKIEEDKKMLEFKRNKYIEMLALNEKAKAKSTALSLSSDITRHERLKLQRNCEEIEQKNIKLRKEIEECNKNLIEQTKIYQAKEKELNFQNKMFATARAQDKKQNEKELNELKLKKEQIKAKINKTKNEKEKDALQKGIEILSNQEKYYLKEQELRQKSIDLLTRQKNVQ